MVAPRWHETGHTLTGNKRVRVDKKCFSKPVLVLQLEESYYMAQWLDLPINDLTKIRKRWRDATVEDLTEGLAV